MKLTVVLKLLLLLGCSIPLSCAWASNGERLPEGVVSDGIREEIVKLEQTVRKNWAVVLVPESPVIMAKSKGMLGRTLYGYSEKYVSLNSLPAYPLRVYKYVDAAVGTPRSRIVLVELANTPYVEYMRNPAQGHVGLNFDFKDSRYPVISAVCPGSSAEDAGLKIGDVLLAIEGYDCSIKSPLLLRKMLGGEVSTQLSLKVETAGQPRSLNLQRRKMDLRVSHSSRSDSSGFFDIPVRALPYVLRDAARTQPLLVEFYRSKPDDRIDKFIAQQHEPISTMVFDAAGIGLNVSIPAVSDLGKIRVVRFDMDEHSSIEIAESLGVRETPAYIFVTGEKEFLVDDYDIVRGTLEDKELIARMNEIAIYHFLDFPSKKGSKP